MFAVGHLALGYLVAKVFQKALKTDVNLPLIFLLSLIPDVDLLVPIHNVHRGPTHSIIILTLLFLPILIYYRKRGIPYFAALAQHSLIGDILTSEGVRLLWPFAYTWFGIGIGVGSLEGVLAEWICLILAALAFLATGDLMRLLRPSRWNLLLAVPAGAILLSAFVGFGQPVPTALMVPHVVFLALFIVSITSFVMACLGSRRRLVKKGN